MPLELNLSDEEIGFESEIVLKINYDAEVGSAARVFEIAAELIHSLEDMDRVFSQSIHLGLETALVVEDLEKSSLRIFLRNVLRGVPDDALKDVEIKKLIGHYLGSGLIDHIQKMTIAAIAMADMKVWAQRSYRVWMRLQSLSFPNMFSILCRLR